MTKSSLFLRVRGGEKTGTARTGTLTTIELCVCVRNVPVFWCLEQSVFREKS